MRRSGRHATFLAVITAAAMAGEAAAQGCAMCGTVLGADDPRANAFKWSILFLMAVPYVLAGAVAGWLYLSARRSRAASRHGRLDVEVGGLTADYKESLT
jgi:hypothetical protein